MGPTACRFVDFLKSSGQTIWQLLPLGPPARGDSPYSSYSAFAGNPLLISCEQLVDSGWLTPQQLQAAGDAPSVKDRVGYDQARETKLPLLQQAFGTFQASSAESDQHDFEEFCKRNSPWLDDFARFDALIADGFDPDWSTWSIELIQRQPEAIQAVDERLGSQILFAKFQQFLFSSQWQKLKEYANSQDVRIYGDMPIFVAFESVDVWTNQELFCLNEAGRPTVVAGVPPDYFSTTGQMWGNPLYRWDRMADTNYDWWTQRFRQALELFDILRIDHFRGFESFWEIPADAENAIAGSWKPGPGAAPFHAAREALGELPIVAEDLGLITEEVHHLRDELQFPGMRVIQFGCEHDDDPYHRPEAYPDHSFAYTGTHDNDSVVGWYRHRHENGERVDIVDRYLSGDPNRIHLELISAVLNSAADTAVIPIQDLLGLGSEARVNTPGQAEGNWAWRCGASQLNESLSGELRSMTEAAGRI